jgi:signal transduction histidine kinase
LSVAQLDAKRIKLKKRVYDVHDTLGKVLKDYSTMLKERSQKLMSNIPPEPLFVKADSTYVYIALDNLLSNASKYTPKDGHIGLDVTTSRSYIHITVSDDGIGIHRHMSKHIYEKFKRLKNDYTDTTEGSGLGLYLTKQIVELHNGTIKFKSVPNGGTSFTITLPRVSAPTP